MTENIVVVTTKVEEEVPFTVLQHTSLVDADFAEALEAVPEGWLSINDAALAVEFLPQYVRTLVRKNKVAAVKVPLGGLSKWYIDVESIRSRKRIGRTGIRKYILRVDSIHEGTVRAALDGLDVDYTMVFAYIPKVDRASAEPEVVDEPEVVEIADSDASDFDFD